MEMEHAPGVSKEGSGKGKGEESPQERRDPGRNWLLCFSLTSKLLGIEKIQNRGVKES